jgi:hypothetical protein
MASLGKYSPSLSTPWHTNVLRWLRALSEEGLFRVPGEQAAIHKLNGRFAQGASLTDCSPLALISLPLTGLPALWGEG